MKNEITELRKKTDALFTAIETRVFKVEETTEKLKYAKAWMGKMLGALDVPTPYKNDGKRKTRADIEETADQGTEFLNEYSILDNLSTSEVEAVDYLREVIKELVTEIESMSSRELGHNYSIARTLAYQYLCEARFELGFTLEKMKKGSW